MSDPVILPETASLLALLAAEPGPHLADMPAGVARETYRQMGALFDAPADPAIRTVDFSGGGCPLRAYFPGAPEPGPVIVYMHGGGWVIGDLETHHGLCTLIAGLTGLRVVAVDYRLAPEHPYPAAHEDCLAAAAFVAGSPAVLEAPVTAIAVAGDSAGGNLAFHVATQLTSAPVLGQLLIYPVGDCTSPETGSYRQFADGYLLDRRLMDRFIADYLPEPASRAQPALSPVLHPLPARVPPAVVLTAGLDMLRDQGRALAGMIVGHGGEVHFLEATGLIHGVATMRQALPTGGKAIRQAVGIFAAMIGGDTNQTQEARA